MTTQINGVQMNAKIGMNTDMLYGYIPGNSNATDNRMTIANADLYNNQFRASFKDSQAYSVPNQAPKAAEVDKSVLTKRLDLFA